MDRPTPETPRRAEARRAAAQLLEAMRSPKTPAPDPLLGGAGGVSSLLNTPTTQNFSPSMFLRPPPPVTRVTEYAAPTENSDEFVSTFTWLSPGL